VHLSHRFHIDLRFFLLDVIGGRIFLFFSFGEFFFGEAGSFLSHFVLGGVYFRKHSADEHEPGVAEAFFFFFGIGRERNYI